MFGPCVEPPRADLPEDLTEVRRPKRFVALGDSFSAGEGAPTTKVVQGGIYTGAGARLFITGTDNPSDTCHRSEEAYAVKVARQLGPDWSLDFRACSGAKVGNFDSDISEPARKGKELQQVDGVRPGADLVTFTMGGNDVNFAPIVTACVLRTKLHIHPSDTEAPCRKQSSARVDQLLDELPAKLSVMYGELAGTMKPGGRVVVLGYPRPFPEQPSGPCSSGLAGSFSVPDMQWLNSVTERLDAQVRAEAALAGFSYVDVLGMLTDGERRHDLCIDDGAQRWMNRTIPSDKVWSFHPKAAAHDEEARLVLACVADPSVCAPIPGAPSVFDQPDTPPSADYHCPEPPPGLPPDIACFSVVSADLDGNGAPDKAVIWSTARPTDPVAARIGVLARFDSGEVHGLDTVPGNWKSGGRPLDLNAASPALVIRNAGPRQQILLTVTVGAHTDLQVVIADDRGGGIDVLHDTEGSVATLFSGAAANDAEAVGCVATQDRHYLVQADWSTFDTPDGTMIGWSASYYLLDGQKLVLQASRGGTVTTSDERGLLDRVKGGACDAPIATQVPTLVVPPTDPAATFTRVVDTVVGQDRAALEFLTTPPSQVGAGFNGDVWGELSPYPDLLRRFSHATPTCTPLGDRSTECSAIAGDLPLAMHLVRVPELNGAWFVDSVATG